MPDRKEIILQRLTEEGAKTVTFFQKLSPEQWQQQVYRSGPEWGPGDLLCHFISAEKTFVVYSQDLASGGTGVPRDFDIDAFNANEVKTRREANHPTQTLIAEFERQRADTLAFVRTLADSDFDRLGFHPWFGDTSQENILKLLYRHTMIHQRDMGKAFDTGQPVPHTDVTPPSKR